MRAKKSVSPRACGVGMTTRPQLHLFGCLAADHLENVVSGYRRPFHLVWDGTRGFALTDEERDVVSTVVSPEKALNYSKDAPVEGAVVGVWRRGGRGVGRWPNADPVIPHR